MGNNEVIIDGVNVAECEYCLNNKLKGKGHAPSKSMPYAKETSCIVCKENITKYNFCKHNPNCYFKQLKRLDETCKTLNQQLEKSVDDKYKLNELIYQLQAENEKLKKDIHNIYENCKYCDEFYVDKCNYIKKENKYKQALKDIKEILNNYMGDCMLITFNNTVSARNMIKDKLDEVLKHE